MHKFTTLALLAGLATAAATAPSFAQVAPGQNNPRPTVISGTGSECTYPLEYLPRVTRAQLDSITNQTVDVIPVCESELLGRDDAGWLFVYSNVSTLRQPMARNATLMRALTARGYDEHDVISLRVGGGNSIILYVHQRYLR